MGTDQPIIPRVSERGMEGAREGGKGKDKRHPNVCMISV